MVKLPHPAIRTRARAGLAALTFASALITATASAQSATDTLSVAADKGRILGSDKAPIWMLIVSDYQCPFCKQWHDQTWAAIKREYVNTGKVRVAYVQFPLGIHPNARPASIAAMCASAQGKFWPMTDLIFRTQDRWKDLKDPRPLLDSLVRAGGLDQARHRRCMDAPSVAALVEADRVRMTRAGTESTPTFYIGGTRLAGAEPVATFRRAIDAELAAAAKKPR